MPSRLTGALVGDVVGEEEGEDVGPAVLSTAIVCVDDTNVLFLLTAYSYSKREKVPLAMAASSACMYTCVAVSASANI